MISTMKHRNSLSAIQATALVESENKLTVRLPRGATLWNNHNNK